VVITFKVHGQYSTRQALRAAQAIAEAIAEHGPEVTLTGINAKAGRVS
jgi:hypothetical protein